MMLNPHTNKVGHPLLMEQVRREQLMRTLLQGPRRCCTMWNKQSKPHATLKKNDTELGGSELLEVLWCWLCLLIICKYILFSNPNIAFCLPKAWFDWSTSVFFLNSNMATRKPELVGTVKTSTDLAINTTLSSVSQKQRWHWKWDCSQL